MPAVSATSLTCRRCSATFSSRQEAKAHYSSNWHQLNLMRTIQGHSMLTKVEHEALIAKSTYLKKGTPELYTHECKVCKKSFLSQGSYETHIRSKKHKAGLTKKAAENYKLVRAKRLEEKKLAEGQNSTESMDIDGAKNDVQSTAMECWFCPGKNSKTAVFATEKDYSRHIQTESHKIRVKARKMEDDRRKHLDELDEKATPLSIEGGEANEEDDGEWEDMDDDEGEERDDEDEEGPVPVNRCFLCGKKFKNMEHNLGHMERQHNFFLPYKHSVKLQQLLEYIGNKVGVEHDCMDCSRHFNSLQGVRTHMLAKPHHQIRFEGEYDAFFELEKILAPFHPVPMDAALCDGSMLPMPNGGLLTHRDLKEYFRQRLREKPVLKRLVKPGFTKAITHLGKNKPGSSVVEMRKAHKLQNKQLHVSQQKQYKQQIGTGIRANKLQHHFRLQVTNAG